MDDGIDPTLHSIPISKSVIGAQLLIKLKNGVLVGVIEGVIEGVNVGNGVNVVVGVNVGNGVTVGVLVGVLVGQIVVTGIFKLFTAHDGLVLSIETVIPAVVPSIKLPQQS
jgi:hypothetical protein